MRKLKKVKWEKSLYAVVMLLFCLSLTACVSGRAHENFRSWMQEQVGKSADDPDAYMNRYRRLHVSTTRLLNGNLEEQYRSGRGSCRVYFEIDKVSRKIVRWRYDGTQDDCAIVP